MLPVKSTPSLKIVIPGVTQQKPPSSVKSEPGSGKRPRALSLTSTLPPDIRPSESKKPEWAPPVSAPVTTAAPLSSSAAVSSSVPSSVSALSTSASASTSAPTLPPMSLGLSLGAVPFGLSLDIGGAAHVGPDFSHIPELEPIEPALSDDTSTALKSPKGVFEFVEETIASGSRGSILKGTWQKDGGEPQPCVVKVMPLGKLKEGDGLLEGTGHDSVSRSEHVVTLYDFGRTDEHVYMVMEPCDTSLKDACYEPYQSSHDARKAMASALLQALKDVHDTGHLHGDIKPANILLKDGKVLLADFGGFKASPSSQLQGTHHYLAPDSPQTDRTDIYMLGVTLAEVGFGLKFTEVTHSIHTAMKFSQVMTTEMDKVIKRVAPHETYEALEASLAEAPLSEENSESAVKHCIDTLLAYKDTVPFTAQKEGLAFVARMLEPSSTRPSSTALLSEAYLNS